MGGKNVSGNSWRATLLPQRAKRRLPSNHQVSRLVSPFRLLTASRKRVRKSPESASLRSRAERLRNKLRPSLPQLDVLGREARPSVGLPNTTAGASPRDRQDRRNRLALRFAPRCPAQSLARLSPRLVSSSQLLVTTTCRVQPVNRILLRPRPCLRRAQPCLSNVVRRRLLLQRCFLPHRRILLAAALRHRQPLAISKATRAVRGRESKRPRTGTPQRQVGGPRVPQEESHRSANACSRCSV